MKYKHLAFALASPLLINACVEVEDNNTEDNSDLVAVLTTQNQILTDQNTLLAEQAGGEEETASVSMRGLIYDVYTDAAISTAVVSAKIGDEVVAENVAVSEGIFELTGLPTNSDIEIIVSDEAGNYMTRVFYTETGSVDSGVRNVDMGGMALSKPLDIEFSVLDEVTLQPFPGLVFTANSAEGDGASYQQYLHTSNYDEASGVYTMQVPSDLGLWVNVKLDLNSDGEGDLYIVTADGDAYADTFFIRVDELEELEELYARDLNAEEGSLPEVTVNIAIVNDSLEAVSGLEIVVDDNVNDSVAAQFNEESGQYELTVNYDGHFTIEIPAFTDGDTSYTSSFVTIDDDYNDDNVYDVVMTNVQANYSSYHLPKGAEINLVVNPNENNTPSEVDVVVNRIDEVTGEYNVFYSQAVDIAPDEVSLTNTSDFVVIEGSADDDDLILPGTTLITKAYSDVPLNVSSSLGGTKHTFTPSEELLSGDRYEYEIGEVTIVVSGVSTESSFDEQSFTTESTTSDVFSIDQIKLDNNDYYNEGVLITPENTAGEASTATPRDNSVLLYLPTSISSLTSFVLQQESVTEDGVTRTDRSFYEIISDSYFAARKVGLYALAENENVIDEYSDRSTFYASAQPNAQSVYYYSTREYMPDNTADNENSITFSYAYETAEGEVFTGVITVPVQ